MIDFVLLTALLGLIETEENQKTWTLKGDGGTIGGEFLGFENNHVFIKTIIGAIAVHPNELIRDDVRYYRNLLQAPRKERARQIRLARYNSRPHYSHNKVFYRSTAYFLMPENVNRYRLNFLRAVNANMPTIRR